MKKIFGFILGVLCNLYFQICYANEAFDVLPDLPESLTNAAQASSVSTNAADVTTALASQSVGHEPSFVSMIFSLVFVVLLIYATGILYTKLNKFGANAMKRQRGDLASSQVSVVSTTQLGSNKSLHVVELDGKRMLIGASSTSIQLIKDLGNFPPSDDDVAFSKIEIPNIRIPKIEIPKIEIPGFTKVVSKIKEDDAVKDEIIDTESQNSIDNEDFEITDIYEENSDGIIDKLFQTETVEKKEETAINSKNIEHKVDPDDFALYKKYL